MATEKKADNEKAAKPKAAKAAAGAGMGAAGAGGAGVKKGDKVKVNYVGKLDDGTEFDSSLKHGAPLEFEAGAGMVIPGFDNAVIGMKKGEKKTVKIPAKDAYGERRPELMRAIPRASLPADKNFQPGMVMVLGTPDGHKFPAVIAKVDEKELMLDLNHPLAGKALTFEITIVE
jgi:peptidylprolyl isomerase